MRHARNPKSESRAAWARTGDSDDRIDATSDLENRGCKVNVCEMSGGLTNSGDETAVEQDLVANARRKQPKRYKLCHSSAVILRPMISSASRIIMRSCGTEYSVFEGMANRCC